MLTAGSAPLFVDVIRPRFVRSPPPSERAIVLLLLRRSVRPRFSAFSRRRFGPTSPSSTAQLFAYMADLLAASKPARTPPSCMSPQAGRDFCLSTRPEKSAVANAPRRAFDPRRRNRRRLVVVVVVVRERRRRFRSRRPRAAQELSGAPSSPPPLGSSLRGFFFFSTVSVGTAGFFVSSTSSLASESSLASLALAMYAAKSSSLSLSSVRRANDLEVRLADIRRPRTA